MFNERDYTVEADNEEDKPYIVDFHRYKKLTPYEWITVKDKDPSKTLEWDKKIKFFFVAKHENSGKIESHLWFFKGLCGYSNPDYCQMIDAGTIPCRDSISKICSFLDHEPRIGGACGEIEVYLPSKRELGYGYAKETDKDYLKKIDEIEKKVTS